MKKILLIMPKFYDLYDQIFRSLSKNYDVTYFEEEIPFTNFDKFITKFSKKNMTKKFATYIEKNLFEKYKGQDFKKIIIIFAGAFYWTENIVKLIKINFPKAEMVYYAWDSIKNVSNGRKFLYLFDRTFSYDYHDCVEYNMKFLPIFYHLVYPKNNILYDCTTVTSFYISKVENLSLINSCLNSNVKKYFYIYMPSKLSYLSKKILYSHAMSKYKMKDFKFKKINSKECVDIFSKGKCIVDVPLEGNYGLTSRIINALYNQKKIITTNIDIKNYTFYSSANIFVVTDEKTKIPEEFFSTPFDDKYKLDENFSVDTFCSELTGLSDINYSKYYSFK